LIQTTANFLLNRNCYQIRTRRDYRYWTLICITAISNRSRIGWCAALWGWYWIRYWACSRYNVSTIWSVNRIGSDHSSHMSVLNVRLKVALTQISSLTRLRLTHEDRPQTTLFNPQHLIVTARTQTLVLLSARQTKYVFARNLSIY
jgi:hypothetical protein